MKAQDVFKRVEKKYMLSEFQHLAMRKMLEGIAAVDEYGETQILNIYYDTDDFKLIRTSIDKPVYKEKLRLRSYGTPSNDSVAFIELKKKFRGVVYKRRIPMKYREALAYLDTEPGTVESEAFGSAQDWTEEERQIFGEIEFFRQRNEGLAQKMMVAYDRIAMAGLADPEMRITFDTNIRWRTDTPDLRRGGAGNGLLHKGQHLMEIKIAGAMPLVLAQILSRLQIFPISYSKYGSGYAQMLQVERAKLLRKIAARNKEADRRAERKQAPERALGLAATNGFTRLRALFGHAAAAL